MKTERMSFIKNSGWTGTLAERITKNWLIGLRESNPAIIDMFKERDMLPYRDLLPWSGEFSGKYITGAYYIYRLTLNKELYDYIQKFIEELLTCQDSDGYLGCYSDQCHLTGRYSQDPKGEGIKDGHTWDAWSHYHNMFGLYLWYHETGNVSYWNAVIRAAELFLKLYYNSENGNKSLLEMGDREMNLGIFHMFAILYTETSDERYLNFAKGLESDLAKDGGGDYLNNSLAGKDFCDCPYHRWEVLHTLMGIAELYRSTGDSKYLESAVNLYQSILKTDVHNTGAFSTGEGAVGNPFTYGPIETCCVIAFNAFAVEVFKLTGKSDILDFLEISHFNAGLGLWSPSGRWSTYDTPMDGTKCSSAHSINFQCRPGSPDLNCCSVNASRIVGMVSEWAVTSDNEALYLNYYEDSEYETENGVHISVEGGYPLNDTVKILVGNYNGLFRIRIPSWSKNTEISVNGVAVTAVAGEFLSVTCDGQSEINVKFDFSAKYLCGERDVVGKVCVYRGPLLFGADAPRFVGYSVADLPDISWDEIRDAIPVVENDTVFIPLSNGAKLCDFYHLGITGAEYRTWLPIIGLEK